MNYVSLKKIIAFVINVIKNKDTHFYFLLKPINLTSNYHFLLYIIVIISKYHLFPNQPHHHRIAPPPRTNFANPSSD